jgi:hypothetical protein
VRPPGVTQSGFKLASEHLGEAVLETFAALVGEGNVARIRLDTQLTARRMRRGGGEEHRDDYYLL